jgi:hypothetical protein
MLPKITRLNLTDEARYLVALARAAIARPGEACEHDWRTLEQAKCDLADEILALVDAQDTVPCIDRRALPRRAGPPIVVEVSLRPKRRGRLA